MHNKNLQTHETLSDQWWSDAYCGNIIPNTLQGSPRGIYAYYIITLIFEYRELDD